MSSRRTSTRRARTPAESHCREIHRPRGLVDVAGSRCVLDRVHRVRNCSSERPRQLVCVAPPDVARSLFILYVRDRSDPIRCSSLHHALFTTRSRRPPTHTMSRYLMRSRSLVICLLLVFFSPIRMSAQSNATDGALDGFVRDPSAASVPSATLVATNIRTGLVTTTTANAEGYYRFPLLQVGEYEVLVSAPGARNGPPTSAASRRRARAATSSWAPASCSERHPSSQAVAFIAVVDCVKSATWPCEA